MASQFAITVSLMINGHSAPLGVGGVETDDFQERLSKICYRWRVH